MALSEPAQHVGHRMDAVGNVRRPQHIHLLGAGGSTANIDASRRSRFTKNYGATGEGIVVRHVPHPDAWNVRKSFHNLVVW